MGKTRQSQCSHAPNWLRRKKETQSGEFSNGQRYEVWKTDDFEIKYPSWPNIDKKNLLEPQNIKLALANDGCNFVISAIPIPANTSFKEFTEKRFQEQTAKFISKIITKDIKENTAYIDGELSMGNTTLKSVSHGYFTSSRQSYSIGFIAEKSQFETACQPIIDDVIESVKIK